MSLPVLHGERLRLVPVEYDVAVAVLEGRPLPGVLAPLRPAAGWPHEDTPDALRALAEHGRPGDDGGWLVVTRQGVVVGDCGWRGGPGPAGDAEIGYGLAAGSRGQGLGTEAVAVMCAWAERRPGVRRLVAEVLPGNEPSLRLLRRLGFTRDPAGGVGAVSAYLRLARDAPPPRQDERPEPRTR